MNDLEESLISDLLYKIEMETNPDLNDSEWLLVIEALEYYKEDKGWTN